MMEDELINFARWFNEEQWKGGKGDSRKTLFVKQDFEAIVKIYLTEQFKQPSNGR